VVTTHADRRSSSAVVTTHADRRSSSAVVTTNPETQSSKSKSLEKKQIVELVLYLNPPHVFTVLHQLLR
jgi:hypothetical protein